MLYMCIREERVLFIYVFTCLKTVAIYSTISWLFLLIAPLLSIDFDFVGDFFHVHFYGTYLGHLASPI